MDFCTIKISLNLNALQCCEILIFKETLWCTLLQYKYCMIYTYCTVMQYCTTLNFNFDLINKKKKKIIMLYSRNLLPISTNSINYWYRTVQYSIESKRLKIATFQPVEYHTHSSQYRVEYCMILMYCTIMSFIHSCIVENSGNSTLYCLAN